jgi:FMN-dependent NADH-azoreductase
MRNILLVTSSIAGENSKSRKVALDLIAALRAGNGNSKLVTRDVTALPHIDGVTFAAAGTPAEKRSYEQQARAALADALIAETEAADAIVIAAPMYNFSVPSTLKAWIDHIARAGRTFRYTEKGPEGLLKNKKVYIVASRGGVYSSGPASALDFQEPYLRGVLGFVGLSDVEFVYVEGLGMGPEAVAKAVDNAHARIAQLVPQALAA